MKLQQLLAIIVVLLICAGAYAKPTARQIALLDAIEQRIASQEKALADALASNTATIEQLQATEAALQLSKDAEVTLKAQVGEISTQLTNARVDIDKANESASYWKAKQAKALRELWMWRGATIIILSAVGIFIAVKLGVFGAKVIS